MTTPINSSVASLLAQQRTSMPAARSPAAATSGGEGGSIYSDFGAISQLKNQSHADPGAAMHEVSKQFESLFVTMMVKAMRDTIPKDGMFASSAMDSYQDMFDQQLSLDMSRKGSLGLASVIERQLTHTIEPRGK